MLLFMHYLCIHVFVFFPAFMENGVIENYIIILKTCSYYREQNCPLHRRALLSWQAHEKACGAIWHIFYQDY